jgi:hypothetical protein
LTLSALIHVKRRTEGQQSHSSRRGDAHDRIKSTIRIAKLICINSVKRKPNQF